MELCQNSHRLRDDFLSASHPTLPVNPTQGAPYWVHTAPTCPHTDEKIEAGRGHNSPCLAPSQPQAVCSAIQGPSRALGHTALSLGDLPAPWLHTWLMGTGHWPRRAAVGGAGKGFAGSQGTPDISHSQQHPCFLLQVPERLPGAGAAVSTQDQTYLRHQEGRGQACGWPVRASRRR